MKLVAGLGNPGNRYELTRHNAGFLVLDALAKDFGLSFEVKKKIKAEIAETFLDNEKIVLLKPLTYMNLSGEALRLFLKFHDGLEDYQSCLIVYDEYDLEFGRLRLRESGSAGSHNGMKSIVEKLQTKDIPRLRFGIRGNEIPLDLSHYVLSRFDNEELQQLPEVVHQSMEICKVWIQSGFKPALQKVVDHNHSIKEE